MLWWEGRRRNFCQTMWVHDKIITKDIFSTQFCLFTKTTVYVCIETIEFQKSGLLASTRILFCNHKNSHYFLPPPSQTYISFLYHTYQWYTCFFINLTTWIIILQQKHIILALFLCCLIVKNHCKIVLVKYGFRIKIMIFVPN